MAINHKKISLLSKIILVAFVVCAIYLGNVVFFPRSVPNQQYRLIINKNQNLNELADQLKQHEIISNKKIFRAILRVTHKDIKVTAGLYFLKGSISTWGLIKRITNGRPDEISVTLLDGWTFNQLRSYLDGLDDIKHLTVNMTPTDIKNVLKITAPNLEGLFFPDTYFVAPNQSDLEILQISYRLMQTKLTNLYVTRSANTNYSSPYQMLIMASIIQKETNNAKDMFLISTVFNNRLRIKMKLQDDPAVFYGLSGKRVVSRNDFQIDTVYNTYLHYGLPPTPIAIPSYNALLAASQPPDNPKLYYFIAVGNGKTKFSTTYSQHLSLDSKHTKSLSKGKSSSDSVVIELNASKKTTKSKTEKDN